MVLDGPRGPEIANRSFQATEYLHSVRGRRAHSTVLVMTYLRPLRRQANFYARLVGLHGGRPYLIAGLSVCLRFRKACTVRVGDDEAHQQQSAIEEQEGGGRVNKKAPESCSS